MRRAHRVAMLALLAAFVLPGVASATAPLNAAQELADYASDVPTASGYRYDVRDDRGNSLTGLKVAPNPQGGYLGIYYVGFVVKLASSTDLTSWTYVRDLASSGFNPTLARTGVANDSSFLVVYQASAGCSGSGGSSGSCLRFLRYPDLSSLLGGSPSQSFTAPRTLSDCAEGTPNVTGTSIDGQGKLVVSVGFHYSRDCSVFRQAKGTLVDFSSWSAQADADMNTAFESATPSVGGHVRDRDQRGFRGSFFSLYEAELTRGDRSSWRIWLYDLQTRALSMLNLRTHGGSTSFGYPTVTNIVKPDGSGRLIVTYNIFSEGAAPGEAGELLFYRDYDTGPAVPQNVRDELSGYVTDVRGSSAYRYGLKDNVGNAMTALKVAPNPLGGYLGVYQVQVGSNFVVKLATSSDLFTWSYVRDLASSGVNPTIARTGLPNDASFLLVYQSSSGCSGSGGTGGDCLGFLRYADTTALLGGSPSQSFIAPRTLSACSEGTPSVTGTSLDGQGKLVINVGFHYSRDCSVYRQAKGTLVDFSSWSAQVDTEVNNLFESATPTVGGHVEDRDFRRFRGLLFNLHDAQLTLNDPSSWRAWLYDWQAKALFNLTVQTHGGSTSFGYPTMTNITNPDGSGRLIVTYNVFGEGAAPGEAGELLFYKDYKPTVAAAGDISGLSIAGQQKTSDLITASPSTAVLSLGDNQYDNGELANFTTYYDPTWGRFKSTTYPTPGNHDKCPDSGYDEYFGTRAPGCWYSFDLGKWHFISLDSNRPTDTAQLAFLDQDLASTTKKCVAAYWHHPRFSSGSHGDQTKVDPFWTRLYAANADLVINGHDHDYERFAPQSATGTLDYARGIREFVAGTGGRSKTSIGSAKPNSEVRYSSSYGVLRLTLGDTGYSWRFESEAGKTFTDTGNGDCH